MKQIFAAAVLLTAAAVTAGAQALGEKRTQTVTAPPHIRAARCEPAPAHVEGVADCAPQTEQPASRASRVRGLFLSSPPQEFAQTPPAGGGPAPAGVAAPAASSPVDESVDKGRAGFRWGDAFKQSLLFLSVQHGYALTQPKTRRALHGPFLKDYFRSVRSLHGWADGGRFFTNYLAHPMEGSLLGYIQVQNDPAGAGLKFAEPGYWRSRMKAMAWSAAWSTQFEIGPISQASIGNVGEHGKQTYVDIVVTPTVGTALLFAEDIVDRYVVERLERRGKYARIFGRMALNPTRTAANLLRFQKPWHRDEGLR